MYVYIHGYGFSGGQSKTLNICYMPSRQKKILQHLTKTKLIVVMELKYLIAKLVLARLWNIQTFGVFGLGNVFKTN